MTNNTKHEDALLKMGIGYFREHILKTLGIEYEYIDTGSTELIELTIHSLFMDFTFLTTQDMYIHVEFQTTNNSEEEDLQRFHAYEAMYSHKTGKKVITYVIYSGGIEKTKGELDCGLYTYKVKPVYMKNKNADEIIDRLKSKVIAGESLEKEDYAELSLTPLMSGDKTRKDKIKDAILLTRYGIDDDSEKALAMLYTLAYKFLTGKELEEIKEVVAMTKLGQMLVDDGYKRGKNDGYKRGKNDGMITGKIQGALLCGKTPEEVAEMLKISVQEVLKVQEEENLKSIKKL